jgi:hypothetical protein
MDKSGKRLTDHVSLRILRVLHIDVQEGAPNMLHPIFRSIFSKKDRKKSNC